MAVALYFPLADREMIGLPFLGLVFDKFVAEPGAQRRLGDRIGLETGHRLLQGLRQELDAARLALRLGNRIEIILVRIARVDPLANTFKTGGERKRGGRP